MSNGKFAKRKGIATKTMFMILAVVLIVGISVGGTLAWLTATTGPVTNTFTVGDINITLAESENLNLKMVPGNTITKDPKVTVKGGSEACWLFVKVVEGNWPAFYEEDGVTKKVSYALADGWLALGDSYPGVYYRKVEATSADTEFGVLAGDAVNVSGNLTKAELNSITTNPTLTVTAYASQLYKSAGVEFTAIEAWDNVPKS